MRFSIVITSYNQRPFIQAAVDSALRQRDVLREVIVVDDGSTDGSLELLRSYGQAIRLVALPHNQGAIVARNCGAALAAGEYLAFLDGDDVLMPWALGVYDAVVARRQPKVLFGLVSAFRDDVPDVTVAVPETPRGVQFVEYRDLFSKDRPLGICGSGFVVERQAFMTVGGWTSGIFHMDCYDLCAKLGDASPAILMCAPATVWYRVHAGNSIHTVQPFIRMAHRIIDRERAGGYPCAPRGRFQRRAWFGGIWFFWTRRALRSGLYRDAIGLAVRGAGSIAAGVLQRCAALVLGRQPIETIDLTVSR
jgi:glycosyltransferase involved in cell wall biosynthesis